MAVLPRAAQQHRQHCHEKIVCQMAAGHLESASILSTPLHCHRSQGFRGVPGHRSQTVSEPFLPLDPCSTLTAEQWCKGRCQQQACRDIRVPAHYAICILALSCAAAANKRQVRADREKRRVCLKCQG